MSCEQYAIVYICNFPRYIKGGTVIFQLKHVRFKEDFRFKQDFTLAKMKKIG